MAKVRLSAAGTQLSSRRCHDGDGVEVRLLETVQRYQHCLPLAQHDSAERGCLSGQLPTEFHIGYCGGIPPKFLREGATLSVYQLLTVDPLLSSPCDRCDAKPASDKSSRDPLTLHVQHLPGVKIGCRYKSW